MSLKAIVMIGMWVLCGICIFVMKKLEPSNKLYPVWALFIAILFSLATVGSWLG